MCIIKQNETFQLIFKRFHSKDNNEKFYVHLQQHNWFEISNYDSANEKFSIFYNEFLDSLNKCVPLNIYEIITNKKDQNGIMTKLGKVVRFLVFYSTHTKPQII